MSERAPRVAIRAYGPLGVFIRPARRGATFERALNGTPSVKDVVEAAGIPHPEIGLLLVDGEAVGFDHRLAGGERVAVFPPFRSIDLADTVRPGRPPADPAGVRFVIDGHLGRLAAYLRMAGFDAWYAPHATDDELARVAADEERVLLTRDLGLLKRSIVTRGSFVRSERPAEQLVEILDRFDLADAVRPFTRCLRCNATLEPIDRVRAAALVPPRVRVEQTEFRTCPRCGRLFWRGSHHRRMERSLAAALEQASCRPGQGARPDRATSG